MANEGDNVVGERTQHGELKEMVATEVGEAIKVNLPKIMEEVESNIMGIVEGMLTSKFDELKKLVEEGSSGSKNVKRCTYRNFMSCNPTVFKGEIDPLECLRWISDMEGVFARSHCEGEDEVMFATGQLRLRAKDWWDSYSKEVGQERVRTMTWAEFKEPFLKHHYPQTAIDRIQEEFLHLRQKNETIDEITNIFLDKMKFCPELVGTERMKINRYHAMLRAEYREFITASKCNTLGELIDWARERETKLKRQEQRGEKRKAEKTWESPKKAKG